jgi:tRNA pseudouridine55 synthase
LDKRYVATLRLGATSDTDDRTGRIAVYGQHTINNEQHVTDGIVQSPLSIVHIDEVLKKFTGKIMQVPPMYSAKKIKGKKLYELAREGKTVERAPVPIEVYSIEESKFQQPNSRKNPNTNNQIPNNSSSLEPDSLESGFLKLDIHCSSGTYIRGLARDIGAALGCGAYLEELERTAIGPFTLEEAITMDNLAKDGAGQHLLEVANILARAHR